MTKQEALIKKIEREISDFKRELSRPTISDRDSAACVIAVSNLYIALSNLIKE